MKPWRLRLAAAIVITVVTMALLGVSEKLIVLLVILTLFGWVVVDGDDGGD